MKKLIYLGIPLMMLVLASCSNSKITSSWKPDEQNSNIRNAAGFKKIVVVGLFSDSNRAVRQQMEEELAADLKAEGFDVVTSFSLYGPKSFSNMSEDEVISQLHNNGIDGVITINLLDKDKEKKFVSNSRNYRPYTSYYNPYRPYRPAYRNFYRPSRGHYESSTNFVFETNFYDVNNKQLIYSVQSQSFEPASVGAMAEDYSKSILKDMKKNNVIG